MSEKFTSYCSGSFGLQRYSWFQGAPPTKMKLVRDYFCSLHGVQGKFRGGGEVVHVYRDYNPDPNVESWWLGGASGETGVAGEAWCAPKSCFSQPERVAYVSPEFYAAKSTTHSGCFDNPFDPSFGTNTWPGDSVTMLTGIQGKLVGNGQIAWITQGWPTSQYSTLTSYACDSFVASTAYAIFAGHVGHPANVSGEWRIEAGPNNNTSIYLENASTSYCYLTYIKGSFQGASEHVRLNVNSNNNTWQLSASGFTTPWQDRPGVGARCYRYDQDVVLPN